MTDRLPGAPGRCKAVVTAEELQKMQSGNEFAITLRRDDQPILEGTPYSKAAVLPDSVAAALCPGVDDPTPGDAFGALQSQKADTVRKAYGNVIALSDTAGTPLMGFKLYGKTTQNGTPTPDAPVALESAGDSGSVEVKVTGKNIYDKTAYPLVPNCWINQERGNLVGGDADFAGLVDYMPVSYLQGKTITLNLIPSGGSTGMAFYNANKEYISGGKGNAVTVPEGAEYMRFTVDVTYADGELVQLELGAVATEYEPYKEAQTLTVPTPNGLPGIPVKTGGNYTDANGQRWICDEIDFVKGVYVKRTNQIILDGSSDEEWWNGHLKAPWGVKIPGIAQGLGDDSQLLCDAYEVATYNATWNNYDYMVTRHGTEPTNITVCFRDIRYLESDKDTWLDYIATNPITIQYVLAKPITTELTEEQLEAYAEAALHTYAPATVLTNDAAAEMELTYYTPTTAVQMVYGPANKGKTFTIDEHGCVILTRDNPVVACGNTTLDGVTWYYRKWADGFAECWGGVSKSYDAANGVYSTLEVLLPFEIRSIHYGSPSVFLRLSNSAYQYVDIGDVHDVEGGYVAINITVPEDALQDEFVSYSGDIYVAGYWKEPEVTV